MGGVYEQSGITLTGTECKVFVIHYTMYTGHKHHLTVPTEPTVSCLYDVHVNFGMKRVCKNSALLESKHKSIRLPHTKQ